MRTPLRLRAGLFGSAVVITAAALSIPAASAGPATDQNHHPRPTVVLVHGAWADSSSWNDVTRRLQDAGYPVDVLPNPLRGLTSDAAYLADFRSTVSGPIVLVGHSYGGAVITNAATGNPNVKALVYVNAFLPDQNETVLELAGAQPGSALGAPDPSTVFTFVPYPGSPPGDADAYVLPNVFPNAFANDLPVRTANVLAATQRPVTLSALAIPSGAPAWRSIPSWALVGTPITSSRRPNNSSWPTAHTRTSPR